MEQKRPDEEEDPTSKKRPRTEEEEEPDQLIKDAEEVLSNKLRVFGPGGSG